MRAAQYDIGECGLQLVSRPYILHSPVIPAKAGIYDAMFTLYVH
jgi:hypothetical protein